MVKFGEIFSFNSPHLVGLDIGTSSIKVAVIENRAGRPALHSVFKESSAGLRKGAIVDMAEASAAIARALSAVKQVSRTGISNIYVNVGTHQSKAQNGRGIIAVSRADSEIYQDDIERVIKASQAITLPPNRMIVHNVVREYVVDGVGDIVDPLGLSGTRLEVNSLIVDAFAPHVKSVMRAIELAGGKIGGMVFGPLASSRAVLTKHQKNLGVALIDIGFGTTSVSVYEDNKLVGLVVLPIGAGNITNDLAVALKIPVDAAEALKLSYGYAVASGINVREAIELRKFSPESKGMVSRRFVAEIIEMRLAEIFELVNNELRLLKKVGQLVGGVVLVGGGAKLPGATELAKQVLKLSSQVGFSGNDEWTQELAVFSETFEDPEFVNALGLALWAADKENWSAKSGNSIARAKNIVKYFLP